MQRKFNQKPVYLTERSKLDREFIYLHMSNHYRRIVNAKKAIDNSPPTCFKVKRPATSNPGVTRTKINRNFETLILTDRSLSTNSNKDSSWGADSFAGGSRYHARCVPEPPPNISSPKLNCDMDLIDRITYDTKHGPAAYCDKGWTTKTKEHSIERRYTVNSATKENKPDPKPSPVAKRSLSTSGNNERTQKRKFSSQKKLKQSEVSPKETKSVPSMREKFGSRSLKTAVSKLRSLRVYHPPRRIELRTKAENSRSAENASNLEAPQCKCTKICICDGSETVPKKMSLNPKEQSITSSRDSAYNGGVSSVPESRSPTPDQKRKKECSCCCCERVQRMSKVRESIKKQQPVAKPPEVKKPASRSPSPSLPKAQKQAVDRESYEKMQNDALYVTFIQEITTEILDKNLYTNKALKKVMKKHLKKNLKKLNKDRMLQELENLRVQLGIPEDKSLFDLSIEESDSLTDLTKSYPIISDSEFVLPPPKPKPQPVKEKPSKQIMRSVSAVFGLDKARESSPSETDEGNDVSPTRSSKSKREDSAEKTPTGHTARSSRDLSSDDSDRPSDPKKRSVFKNRRPKLTKNYPNSSSDSEMSGSFLKTDDGNRKEILPPKDTSPSKSGRPRSVSFWNSPDGKFSPVVMARKTVVTHSEESIVVDFKKTKPKVE